MTFLTKNSCRLTVDTFDKSGIKVGSNNTKTQIKEVQWTYVEMDNTFVDKCIVLTQSSNHRNSPGSTYHK